jgi:hypothetical protein
LKTSEDYDFWWFTVEFSISELIERLMKSCPNNRKFFQKLWTARTDSQQNILMIAVPNEGTFNYLLRQLIDSDQRMLRRMLTEVDSQGWNVLRYSIYLRDDQLDFFVETYKTILGKQVFLQVLKETDKDGYSLLLSGLKFDRQKKVFCMLAKYLTTKSMISILKLKNNQYENGLYHFCEYIVSQAFNKIWIEDAAEQLELLCLVVKHYDSTFTTDIFKKILIDPELKTLFKFHDEEKQYIFDIANAK